MTDMHAWREGVDTNDPAAMEKLRRAVDAKMHTPVPGIEPVPYQIIDTTAPEVAEAPRPFWHLASISPVLLLIFLSVAIVVVAMIPAGAALVAALPTYTPSPSPTPTSTPYPTATSTPTATATNTIRYLTPTLTPSLTPTLMPSPTQTYTPTSTPYPTATITPSPTIIPDTITPSQTAIPTITSKPKYLITLTEVLSFVVGIIIIYGVSYTAWRAMIPSEDDIESIDAPDMTDIRLRQTIKSKRALKARSEIEAARRAALWILEWGARRIDMETGYSARRLARIAIIDGAFSTRRDKAASLTAWLRDCGALVKSGRSYSRKYGPDGRELTPLQIMQCCEFPPPEFSLPNIRNPFDTTNNDDSHDDSHDK